MKFLQIIIALYCILLIAACVTKPFADTNAVYKKQAKKYAATLQQKPTVVSNDSIKAAENFVGTVNFTMRKPNFVIIHHTAQNSCNETLKTFTTTKREVSAHYVICRDGVVYNMLNDYLRAHHAGVSKWGNVIDMNSCSIGIELDNNGFEPFSDAQISSLISLLGILKKKYSIPTPNFIGHGDIAPTRKNDPSILFPWKKLAENGFGLWYDEQRLQTPENFNYLVALKVIGYDIKDTTAAICSFKRHFMQDSTKRINEADKNVLYNLMQKY